MTRVLKKEEFIAAFALKHGVTKKRSEEILDDVWDTIDDVVFEQQAGVKLGNIGTLKVKLVPEREHNKPKSDEKVIKPEHYALKFKVNKKFKEDLETLEVQ